MSNIGEIRSVVFAEGVVVTDPTSGAIAANTLDVFANDAAYETANGVGANGALYYNSTTNNIRLYRDGAWGDLPAESISYDSSASSLSSSTVQDAITENSDRLDTAENSLAGHLDAGDNKHDASEIDYESSSKTDIQGGSDDLEAATQDLDDKKASIDAANSFDSLKVTEFSQAVASTTPLGRPYVRLTAGATTIDGFDNATPNAGNKFTITNDTGVAITLVNESATELTPSRRIVTGSGANLTLGNGASIDLIYNTNSSRFQVVGDTGGAGSNFVTTDTPQDITADKTFTTPITFEKQGSSPAAASSGDAKMFVKDDGLVYLRGEGSEEYRVGELGSVVNLIQNPNAETALDKSATNSVGDWIDSGVGTTATRTTTNSEIPLDGVRPTALKVSLSAGTADYTRVRFRVPESLRNSTLKIGWYQKTSGLSANQVKFEIYNYSDAYVSGETEVALQSDDGSGDSYINTNSIYNKTTFASNTREYYELRIINDGATSGFVSFNEVSIDISIGGLEESTEIIDLSVDSPFTGGVLKASRIGSQVMISSQGPLSHTSSSQPQSTLAFSSQFQPLALTKNNCHVNANLYDVQFNVNTTGTVQLVYWTSGNSTVNQTSTTTAVSICYVV